jgi:hypothetical protein
MPLSYNIFSLGREEDGRSVFGEFGEVGKGKGKGRGRERVRSGKG